MFSDEKLTKCSLQARLSFIGLLTESDDEGRQLYSGARIAGAIFPLDNFATKKVMGWIGELEMEGVVHPYEVSGGAYLCVPNFKEHQIVSHPARSVYPPCTIHGVLPEPLRKSSGKSPEPLRPEVEVGIEREKEVELKEPDVSGPESQTPPTDLSDWAKRLSEKSPWGAEA